MSNRWKGLQFKPPSYEVWWSGRARNRLRKGEFAPMWESVDTCTETGKRAVRITLGKSVGFPKPDWNPCFTSATSDAAPGRTLRHIVPTQPTSIRPRIPFPPNDMRSPPSIGKNRPLLSGPRASVT
ncbi:hypothetical protein ACLOJK_040320 [Asimina triloba]